jgi:hypothetical protein
MAKKLSKYAIEILSKTTDTKHIIQFEDVDKELDKSYDN